VAVSNKKTMLANKDNSCSSLYVQVYSSHSTVKISIYEAPVEAKGDQSQNIGPILLAFSTVTSTACFYMPNSQGCSLETYFCNISILSRDIEKRSRSHTLTSRLHATSRYFLHDATY